MDATRREQVLDRVATALRVMLILLFAAAGLAKGAELLTWARPPGEVWYRTYEATTAAAMLDLALAYCLTTGLALRFVLPLTAALLAAFAAFNVYLVVLAQPSCGCFGSWIEIPPWVMALIDVAAVGATLFVHRRIMAACPTWRSSSTTATA